MKKQTPPAKHMRVVAVPAEMTEVESDRHPMRLILHLNATADAHGIDFADANPSHDQDDSQQEVP